MSEVRLQVKHVSKNFGITKALKDVSFNINKGEVHALIGENGSGKSTILKIITGVLSPTEGEVSVDGRSRRCWSLVPDSIWNIRELKIFI